MLTNHYLKEKECQLPSIHKQPYNNKPVWADLKKKKKKSICKETNSFPEFPRALYKKNRLHVFLKQEKIVGVYNYFQKEIEWSNVLHLGFEVRNFHFYSFPKAIWLCGLE